MRILAVDPGYGRMGVAIVDGNKTNYRLIHSDCFITKKEEAHADRLFYLAEKIEELLKNYSPDTIAVENLLWSKNKKTALSVSEVKGLVLTAAVKKKIKVVELNPLSIKVAITGYGRSDKTAIALMVKKLLGIKDNKKRLDDEYDAIAIAITALLLNGNR
jgi:crossover junction endodeoxyribonuclease RuvC